MTDESVYALTNEPAVGSVGFNARRVVCPGCDTRYLVAAEAFQAVEGRRVRCASCGHSWRYSPAPEGLQPSFLEEAAKARTAAGAKLAPAAAQPSEPVRPEALFAAEPLFAGPSARPTVAAQLAGLARRPVVRAALLGTAVLAAVVLVALLVRGPIAALYPSTTHLYALLGLGEAAGDKPGAGLTVTITPTRSQDAVVIKGDIINSAAIPRPVPRLRLTLLDDSKGNLDSQVISPPVARLGPGATTHFDAVFAHPTNKAVRVNVSFAAD